MVKKTLSVLLSLVIMLSVFSALPFTVSSAKTYRSEDYTYTVYDGYATIQNYFGSDEDVVIPSTLDGYTVTKIGYGAFNYSNSLTSLTIPDSITYIPWASFVGVSNLVSITVDKDNKVFDSRDNCNAIFETNTNKLIKGCKATTIPDYITRIESGAFYGCSKLTSIAIPASVKSIGSYAFCQCTGLEVVNYGGSESDWEQINIGSDNESLINAFRHCEPAEPVDHEGSLYCNTAPIDGIDVSFRENWFFNDSSAYNHDIAKLSSEMLLEGYIAEDKKESDLTKALNDLGFIDDNIEKNLNTGRNQMNYFIASKPISQGGKTCPLVYIGCIGSWHEQWNSNFDPKGHDSNTGYTDSDKAAQNHHRGFNDAKNFIYYHLVSYLEKHSYDPADVKILLTGHSRGAATANLLAAKLIDEESLVKKENLFTYTFATPNCTKDDNKRSGKYNRIFNIVFPTDFVTKVLPAAWGYGRYGKTYSLPTKTNDNRYSLYKKSMLNYYRKLNNSTSGNTSFHDYFLGEADVRAVVTAFNASVHGLIDFYYHPYQCGYVSMTPFIYFQSGLCPMVNHTTTKYGSKESGYAVMLSPFTGTGVLYTALSAFFIGDEGLTHNFSDAHKMETYCAFMLGLSSDELTAYRKGFLGTVNCPVDVEIINKSSGEVVGRIVNNTVDEEIAAKENAVVMTVDGDTKEYWLPSNGDYEVRLTGSDRGVMDYTLSEVDSDLGETERKNFYDIPLEKDAEYVCAAEIPDPETAPELSNFTLTDEAEEEVTPDEAFTTEDAVEYTVIAEAEGSGSADSITVKSGDYATLSASPVRSEFIGWYDGATLLSTDEEYCFRPTSDMTLTAKFTDMAPLLLGDTDGDDEIMVLDAACIQRNLAHILTPVYFELASDTDSDGEITPMDATLIQMHLAAIPSGFKIGEPINKNKLYIPQ